MSNEPEQEPQEDIPAWFMTYSDVITLLMTFFILLLTFSSTEPEKYERVAASLLGSDSATGTAGHQHTELDRDSWAERMRPRAARIAVQGSEMPATQTQSATSPSGSGLEAPTNEQATLDVTRCYAFEVPIDEVMNSQSHLTDKGKNLARVLGFQLQSLPMHCSIEFSDLKMLGKATEFLDYLYHTENVRPGQVAIGQVTQANSGMLRFVLERYEGENGKKEKA